MARTGRSPVVYFQQNVWSDGCFSLLSWAPPAALADGPPAEPAVFDDAAAPTATE